MWEIHRRKAPHKLGNTRLGPFKPCDIRDRLLRFFWAATSTVSVRTPRHQLVRPQSPSQHLLQRGLAAENKGRVCRMPRNHTLLYVERHRHRHIATSLHSSGPRLFRSRNRRNTWLFPPFCDKPFGAQGAYPPSDSLTLSGTRLEPQQIVGIDPSRHRSLRKRITRS